MTDPIFTIVSPAAAAELRKQHGSAQRTNWALRNGGSVDVLKLNTGDVIAVAESPTSEVRAEIETIFTRHYGYQRTAPAAPKPTDPTI